MQAAIVANDLGIGINAGHDLNLKTRLFLHKDSQFIGGFHWPCAGERVLYLGFENVIPMYLQRLS